MTDDQLAALRKEAQAEAEKAHPIEDWWDSATRSQVRRSREDYAEGFEACAARRLPEIEVLKAENERSAAFIDEAISYSVSPRDCSGTEVRVHLTAFYGPGQKEGESGG